MATQHYERVHTQTEIVNGVEKSRTSSTKHVVKKLETEPSYVKCYLRDISLLHQIQRNTESILWEMLSLMNYQNAISLSSGIKKEICVKLGMEKQVDGKYEPNVNGFNQHLAKLCKVGLLERKDTGVYVANAYLFGKGKWDQIRNIRLEIDYTAAGKVVQAHVRQRKTRENE